MTTEYAEINKNQTLHVSSLCHGEGLQIWQLRVEGSEEAAGKDECITTGVWSGLVPSGLLAGTKIVKYDNHQ